MRNWQLGANLWIIVPPARNAGTSQKSMAAKTLEETEYMREEDIKQLLEQNIPNVTVNITGDGTHFEAVIVSDVFAGKTAVQQHQIVYRALGDKMGTDIHALSLQTYTPEQWDKKKDLRVI